MDAKILPIEVNHLLPVLHDKLIALLQSLSDAEWNRPTIAKLWTVKDIAAHLLDTNLRSISMIRDGFFGEIPTGIDSNKDLIDFLNRLNADWVRAMKRVSPTSLIELLAQSGNEFNKALASLAPYDTAMFSVAWAGEEQSLNWFHVAREYTEKWIHQQQIRHAVNKPGILTKELFHPFIDTFMYGMPYTYRNVSAADGTCVKISIIGDAGDDWFLVKQAAGWALSKQIKDRCDVAVFLDAETAWKLFSKGMSPAEALPFVSFKGDQDLGKVALSMISVMA